jgi:hypothetical protein
LSWAKLIIAVAVVVIVFAALRYTSALSNPSAPVQPIAYSHKQHTAEKSAGGAGIKCDFCHTNDKGRTARMLIPSAQRCALCHRAVKADSPEVQKILKHADEGTEPEWRRVFGLPASANAYFTHVPHLRAGVTCQTCHGPIQEMDRVYRAVNQTMGWCIECHEKTPGQMAQVPNTNVQVNRLTDCAVCHR